MATPLLHPLAETTWDNSEIDAIQRVIQSNFYSMGPEVGAFEKSFASFHNQKYCVMVNSGSSANLLAIAALFFTKERRPLQPGDEVIVPAVSWATTYTPLSQYNLKIVFVDIDPQTLNIDPNQIRKAITPKTRAIFGVNLLGNPMDFEQILEISKEHDLYLIEDNCESLGAKYAGKLAGTFGLMGTYSSFFSHHISTMEGGMITTQDEELYHILLSLRSHGWTRHLPKNNKVTGVKDDDSFKESFKFVLPGYNLRPIEFSGAIGSEQLKKLPSIIHGRRENASEFQKLFKDHPHIQIQNEVGESSWFGFAIILKPSSPIKRDGMISAFAKHGVECRPIVAGNFTKNPVIQYFDHRIVGSLENANYIDENGFFIGNHHYSTKTSLSRIYEICTELF